MSPLDRRAFLHLTAMAGCAACLPLAGCRNEETVPAGPLQVPLAELRDGERVRRKWNGHPLELLRRGDTVTARSLLCTHQGCVVSWRADSSQYLCPCHDGRFDATGNPVYGPPRRPLREFAVEIVGGQAVVRQPEATS